MRELLLAGNRKVREVLVAEDQDDVELLQDIVDLALDTGCRFARSAANGCSPTPIPSHPKA